MGDRIDDAFIKFDQFEKRIDDLEAHAESYDLGVKKDLKDEFTDLENEDAVAKELRDLKSKRAAQNPHAAPVNHANARQAGEEGAVELGELVAEDAHGPAVGDHVVHGE